MKDIINSIVKFLGEIIFEIKDTCLWIKNKNKTKEAEALEQTAELRLEEDDERKKTDLDRFGEDEVQHREIAPV